MNSVILLLALQEAPRAADNFLHHGLKGTLPRKASARRELALHALRSLLYAPVFMMFAHASLRGRPAWLLVALVAPRKRVDAVINLAGEGIAALRWRHTQGGTGRKPDRHLRACLWNGCAGSAARRLC